MPAIWDREPPPAPAALKNDRYERAFRQAERNDRLANRAPKGGLPGDTRIGLNPYLGAMSGFS